MLPIWDSRRRKSTCSGQHELLEQAQRLFTPFSHESAEKMSAGEMPGIVSRQ
jgi:hypothetical protein